MMTVLLFLLQVARMVPMLTSTVQFVRKLNLSLNIVKWRFNQKFNMTRQRFWDPAMIRLGEERLANLARLAAEIADAAQLLDPRDVDQHGRLGQPQDIAEAVVWLCSDRAGFVTGQLLGLTPESCLALGVSTSGHYVRTAESPSPADLAALMRAWPGA